MVHRYIYLKISLGRDTKMKGLCSYCDEHFTDSLNNLDGTLMIAAWQDHVNCVRTMIEAEADVNNSALTSAVIKGKSRVCESST